MYFGKEKKIEETDIAEINIAISSGSVLAAKQYIYITSLRKTIYLNLEHIMLKYRPKP